jgi:hypothetical protein
MERDIAREQFKFLSSYGLSLDSKTADTEEVERFLDMFGPRQTAVAQRLQELDIQISRVKKEYEAQKKVYESGQGAKRFTKVTVVVLADRDGKAELMLTYGSSIPVATTPPNTKLSVPSGITRKLDSALRCACFDW